MNNSLEISSNKLDIPGLFLINDIISNNDEKNIIQNIYLEDWDNEFNEITYQLIDTSKFNNKIKNKDKIGEYYFYDNYKYYIKNLNYNLDEEFYYYNYQSINMILLKSIYQYLTDNDINKILNKYGSKKNNLYIDINKEEWIIFRNNLYKDDELSYIIERIFEYHRFLDKETLLNTIKQPNIVLQINYNYFNKNERLNLSTSNLEYIFEEFHENIFNCNTIKTNLELNFNHLVKELIWVVQPFNFVNKSSFEENKMYDYVFPFFKDNVIENFNFILSNYKLLGDTFDEKYFNTTEIYKHHTNTNNNGIYCFSFSLFPENNQPSGFCNFTVNKAKIMILKFNKLLLEKYPDIVISVYSINYNILNIKQGRANVVY